MNKSLLLKLADFLDKIPRDRFNLREWEDSEFVDNVSPFDGSFECGFAGCAVGWAAHANLIPGLTLRDSTVYYTKAGDDFPHEGFRAIAFALEITSQQANELFHPRYYTVSHNPTIVAKRIREFCGATMKEMG